jgi:hypothetical protein
VRGRRGSDRAIGATKLLDVVFGLDLLVDRLLFAAKLSARLGYA